MKAADWLVIMTVDGIVAGVDGGAPASWVGLRLDECPGVPEGVRIGARRLARGAARPAPREVVRRVRVDPEGAGEPSFTLLTIEAVLLRLEEVALEPLIRRALQPLAAQAASMGVALRVECAPDLPAKICLDPDKISWMVTTLVGNALRHTRRRAPDMPRGNVHVRLVRGAGERMVSISVQDDGQGIPQDVRRWLFQPDPVTGHTTGGALRLAYDVALAHGGGMVVKSSTDYVDRGTTVTLWLPARCESDVRLLEPACSIRA